MAGCKAGTPYCLYTVYGLRSSAHVSRVRSINKKTEQLRIHLNKKDSLNQGSNPFISIPLRGWRRLFLKPTSRIIFCLEIILSYINNFELAFFLDAPNYLAMVRSFFPMLSFWHRRRTLRIFLCFRMADGARSVRPFFLAKHIF